MGACNDSAGKSRRYHIGVTQKYGRHVHARMANQKPHAQFIHVVSYLLFALERAIGRCDNYTALHDGCELVMYAVNDKRILGRLSKHRITERIMGEANSAPIVLKRMQRQSN